MARAALGSVVVPAYNEQAVIARCLRPLAPLVADGSLELVVVCNGCTDETAGIARSIAGVRVVELPVGAKPAALRAGELAVAALPRIYLDADVVLSAEAAVAVLVRLRTPVAGAASDTSAAQNGSDGGVCAARPPVRFATDGCAWPVRRYYRARARIPAVLGSLWGAGVYALSAAGRGRFVEFPDVVADDLWVDQLFAPEEVEIVACGPVTVTAPRRTMDLLAVLSRTYRGKAEHHRRGRQEARETSSQTMRDLRRLARQGPDALVDAAVYTTMAAVGRLWSRARRRTGWERDESSRQRPQLQPPSIR